MQELFDHQRKAAEFIEAHRGVGALFMDVGTGKTRTAIEIFHRLRTKTPGLRMVIVCPPSLIESAWKEDINKFSDFKYVNLRENYLPSWRNSSAEIFIINFQSFILKKNAYIRDIFINNLVVIDESSKMKNHNTKITKLLLEYRHLPKYKIVMSGSPAPNSPMEYWAQLEWLIPGVLHPSFFGFRNTYFHLQRGSQMMQLAGHKVSRELMRSIMTKGWKYEITAQNLELMMEKIKPHVFLAKKNECLDLPDEVDEIRFVNLGASQEKAYRQMKNDLITEIKGHMITGSAALVKAMKMREITSGWAMDGNKETIALDECPKINELDEVLDEVGVGVVTDDLGSPIGASGPQIIIWSVFIWDIERIVSFLRGKFGPGCARTMYSGESDPMGSYNDFKAGKVHFLVANPQSVAHGLTLTNCNIEIFFSLDYSRENFDQTRGRIHRATQVNKCTYFYLLAKNTIDEEIYHVLRKKGNVNEVVERLLRS